jgi:hypothetical protein
MSDTGANVRVFPHRRPRPPGPGDKGIHTGTGNGDAKLLEPNRDQIEIFVDAIFRHARGPGFVSLRAFYEDDSSGKAFITPVQFHGDRRLAFLIDRAIDGARAAAQATKAVVFCPPLAIFSNRGQAREIDIAEAPALSIELDQYPQRGLRILEDLLGPATVAVRSGGIWTNGGNATEDKLHLHYRLTVPAQDKGNLAKLKQARALATKLAGGDASNVPIVHPMRWPGSWHRKKEPRLCEIIELNADAEIDLDTARAKLTAAMQGPGPKDGPGSKEERKPRLGPEPEEPDEDGDTWNKLVADIITGKRYHVPLTKLASRCVGAGMFDGQCVKLLRSITQASIAAHDARWQTRYDAIPRYAGRRETSTGARPIAARRQPRQAA